jgi:hypothetical protein
MRCDEFRTIRIELADGELAPDRAADAEAHAAACPSCAAELDAARDDARRAAEALHAVFDRVRPDPVRRQSFVERAHLAARSRGGWGVPFAAAAAAAALVAVVALVARRDPPPSPEPSVVEVERPADPVETYKVELARQTERRLSEVAARETGNEALDAIVALELWAQEISLYPDADETEPTLEQAVRDLTSREAATRAAAKRALARMPVDRLDSVRIEDPAAARFVQALVRFAGNGSEPKAQGEPIVSIRNSNSQPGRLQELDLKAYANGVVHAVAREGDPADPTVTDVWAHDVYDLIAREPDLCRRMRIVNERGEPAIMPGIKSRHSININLGDVRRQIGGRKSDRALRELQSIKFEALVAEATRSKGDLGLADRIAREVRDALRRSGIEMDEDLKQLRRSVPEERIADAQEWERAYRRARELEVFCDELKKLGK